MCQCSFTRLICGGALFRAEERAVVTFVVHGVLADLGFATADAFEVKLGLRPLRARRAPGTLIACRCL